MACYNWSPTVASHRTRRRRLRARSVGLAATICVDLRAVDLRHVHRIGRGANASHQPRRQSVTARKAPALIASLSPAASHPVARARARHRRRMAPPCTVQGTGAVALEGRPRFHPPALVAVSPEQPGGGGCNGRWGGPRRRGGRRVGECPPADSLSRFLPEVDAPTRRGRGFGVLRFSKRARFSLLASRFSLFARRSGSRGI